MDLTGWGLGTTSMCASGSDARTARTQSSASRRSSGAAATARVSRRMRVAWELTSSAQGGDWWISGLDLRNGFTRASMPRSAASPPGAFAARS